MVTPARQDLTFTRGDDYQIDLTMTTNGSTGISVSGWSSIKAHIRARADSTSYADMTTLITNTAGGVIRFSLTSGQTQTLPSSAVWDLQRVSSGALQTVVAGNVTIRSDVTRT